MKKIILNDLYNWKESGIFKYLDSYNVPWKGTVNANSLDWEYHGTRNFNKCVSPLILSLIDEHGLSDSDKLKLSLYIFEKYNLKWTKKWETMFLEYNPIENYRRTEDIEFNKGEQDDEFHKGAEHSSETIGAQKQKTDFGAKQNKTNYGTQIVETQFGNTETNTENGINGLNSSNYSKDTNSKTTNSSHTDKEIQGAREDTTNFNAYSDELNIDSQTNTNDKDSVVDMNFEGSRKDTTHSVISGNIGVTTSQQMIESERVLWDWNYFNEIFNDVDEVLTSNLYGDYVD